LGYLWQAEVLCCHALAIFKQLESRHGQAHTDNHLGLLYIDRYLSAEARQHLERACALWQAIPDPNGLMRGYINLGMLYNAMKQPDQALTYLGMGI
jgi:tetratricopeptide (TPR) repeat protein